MVLFLTEPRRIEKDKNVISTRILEVTLEIMYLLTGERYTVLKTSDKCVTSSSWPYVSESWSRIQDPIMEPPPDSIIPEISNEQKILELTNKIIELLTGEVPIRCQDVTVHFSMEEWEYLEGHKDLYKHAMIDQLFTSLDGSGKRNVRKRHPRPLCSHDYPENKHEGLQDDLTEHLLHVKVEVIDEEEDMYMKTDQQYGSSKRDPPERCSSHHQDYREENCSSPQDHQGEDLTNIKVKIKSEYEEMFVNGDPQCKEEETPVDVGIADNSSQSDEGDWLVSPNNKVEAKDILQHSSVENLITCNVHPGLHNTELSSNHEELCPDKSQIVTARADERGGKIYQCGECGKRFTKNANLFTHRRIHTGEKPYSCPECGKCFARKSGLNQHKIIHLSQKPFTCSECGKSFKQKSFLFKHKIIHTGEKPFACSECGKHFTQKAHLVQHQRTHTGERPFSCSECEKCFTTKAKLKEHQIIHSGEKPFFCSECRKCFTSKAKLKDHQRTHTGEKPFACSECRKCFAQKSSLVEHQRIHTGEKPYACSECGTCFITKAKLRDHQRSHTGEKPYSCSECGKCFIQKSYLVSHQRIHSENKPYSCSECGKCFIKKSRLLYHHRFHSGERPFSCLECARFFTQKSDLVKHQKIHTGEKPFSCSECGKCFTQKSNLINHQKIHTGEKPFSCSECGKCFTQKTNLINHQKIHSGKKPFAQK